MVKVEERKGEKRRRGSNEGCGSIAVHLYCDNLDRQPRGRRLTDSFMLEFMSSGDGDCIASDL